MWILTRRLEACWHTIVRTRLHIFTLIWFIRTQNAHTGTHLNAFLRDPRNTKDMREAQRETSSARTFEMGEFKGKVRERRVLSTLLKGSPVANNKSE